MAVKTFFLTNEKKTKRAALRRHSFLELLLRSTRMNISFVILVAIIAVLVVVVVVGGLFLLVKFLDKRIRARYQRRE